MKQTFLDEINGKFRNKLSQAKLAESTKQSYLSRMNVLAKELSKREFHYRSQISVTDVQSVIDSFRAQGYTRNRISAMITAYRKFDNYYTKSNMRISTVLRDQHKTIFNYKKLGDSDVGHTSAQAIKNGIPPKKYMPQMFKERLNENLEMMKSTSQKQSDFKESFKFLQETGLRSGAFFGTKAIGSPEYAGINKDQIKFNKDGSVTISGIKDKYAREGWDMKLAKDHPAIKPLENLMKLPGPKLSLLDQKTFEREFSKLAQTVRRDPDIVEKYGNLPRYTPHSLRANFIHDKVQKLVEDGVAKDQAYDTVSELVNHDSSKTTRLYDI